MNKKGFTLIELLAVVVILAILTFYAAPIIADTLETNRNKVYINDAKKLIAQTERKIKSSGSMIDKPGKGKAIAVSMVYIDPDDFDNPPNQGKYVPEYSYVIVKNNNGTLEYAAMLVEQVKRGGYKGVKLTTLENLRKKDATKYVVNFRKKNLISLTTDEAKLTKEYINKEITGSEEGYITGIDEIYNYPDLSGGSAKMAKIPNITVATLASASNKGFNSLDVVLSLKVLDTDSSKDEINVYLSWTSFDAALAGDLGGPFNYGSIQPFRKEFKFDSTHSYDGGEVKLYIVVMDADGNSDRKIAKYKFHQNFPPEILDDSSLTRLPTDKENMTVARLKLAVADDIDEVRDLEVCFSENPNATTCNNYKYYYEYFDNSGVYKYSFNRDKCALDGSTLYLKVFVRDSFGAEVTKTFEYVLYKNSPPIIDNVVITSFHEYNNQSRNVYVKVDVLDDMTEKSKIKVYLSDDENNKLQNDFLYEDGKEREFKFSGEVYDGSTKTLYVTAEDDCGRTTEYYVKDGNNVPSADPGIEYTIYRNTAPVINDLTVTSLESACSNFDYDTVNKYNVHVEEGETQNTNNLCEKANSKNAVVKFTVTDDIDSNDDIKVCVATDTNKCEIDSNYKSYSDYLSNGEITLDVASEVELPYRGQTETIYVYAKDSYDSSVIKTKTYKLYTNRGPKITKFDVETRVEAFLDLNAEGEVNPNTGGSLRTLIYLDAIDDITEKYIGVPEYVVEEGDTLESISESLNILVEDLKRFNNLSNNNITVGQVLKLEDEALASRGPFLTYTIREENGKEQEGTFDKNHNSAVAIPFDLSGLHDGTTRKITVEVKDEYGVVDTSDIVYYKVYQNKAPEINGFDVQNVFDDCATAGEDEACGVDGGSYKVKINLDVYDDVDSNINFECVNEDSDGNCLDEVVPDSKIMVCVSENKSDCNPDNVDNFISYSKYVDENRIYEFNKDKSLLDKYDGSTHNLYAVVKDSSGLVTGWDSATEAKVTHQIYEDQAPVISDSGVRVYSADDDYINSSHAKIDISAQDDLTDQEDLKVKVCYKQGSGTTSDCFFGGAFQSYQDTYDVDFGITDYQGQIFKVFIIVKDSKGQTTTSSEVEYKLYTDGYPMIVQAQAAYKIPGKNNNQVGFNFIVQDPLDTYKLCINKTQGIDSCTWQGNYSGAGLQSYFFVMTDDDIVTYINSITPREGAVTCPEGKMPNEAGTECIDNPYINYNKYYLHVKDSHGNASTTDVIAQEYSQCGTLDMSKTYYSFDLVSGSSISHTRCSGQCYFATATSDLRRIAPEVQTTSNIRAVYNKKVFSHDSFNAANTQCSAGDTQQYEASCDFYECFKDNSGGYNNEVIGIVKRDLPPVTDGEGNIQYDENNNVIYTTWSYQDRNGETEYYNSYYMVYYSSYSNKDAEKITLKPTNKKYPADSNVSAEIKSEFAYNPSSTNGTLRVRVLDILEEE